MLSFQSVKHTLKKNSYATSLFLVAFITATGFSLASPQTFFSALNLASIAYAVPEIALMALAISIAMTTAGIDLSTVAVANLSALCVMHMTQVLSGAGLSSLVSTAISVLCALIIGLITGLMNGVLISVVRIAPILATLATQQLFLGLAIALTKGKPLYGGTPELNVLGVGTLAGIPFLFWLFLIILICIAIFMGRTRFGLCALMLGENPTATDYSGISRISATISTYMLCGLLSSCAGILMAARTASASAGYGGSYLMLAITIAVLGGVNPFGGRIAIWGAAIAAVILQIISSGLNALGVSPYVYQMIQGFILVSVFIFRWEAQRRKHS
ncbi:ABC transporter permease [Schaalia sp. lx-260]|uniref:ABC transporter permease n=1 Tax=Schaalia sp. lx-260 TaxID=2899082 RepID=UPI001E650D86|nr:ABC transporter permease [Schaalia sp. lx-260]MCD4548938.1 ABC transporter permease [Schaalia sp. lx-260]